MTLSQNGAGPAWLEGHSNGNFKDEAALLKEAADGGLPAAQLALAQLYLGRSQEPQDLVTAYTCFLVATEPSFQLRGSITGAMTPEQIEEPKQKASVWLTKLKQIAPS